MPRLSLILACAAGAALTACSDPLASSAQRLAGSWTWVSAYGGIGGYGITPESAGYTEELHFLPHGGFLGVVETYRDDTLYARQRYRLRNRDFGHGEQLVIEYDDRLEHFVQFVADTALILIDLCVDCYRYTYTRVP